MNEIKDLAKFSVLGADIEVSEDDKKTLDTLAARKEKLFNFDPTQLYIETFSEEALVKIFNLKERKGILIKWRNDIEKKIYIKHAYLNDYNKLACFSWCFEKSDKSFKMSVRRFIELYKLGEFHRIEPNQFEYTYFITVKEELAHIAKIENAIKNKYNEIYEKQEKTILDNYYSNLDQFEKLDQEAKAKPIKKNLSTDEAIKVAADEKVKDYWNSKLTEVEKAQLLGWVAANIYSIRIYALLGGQSGNALEAEYADIPGMKLREPKYNENNERTSEDSIGGYVYFKSIKNAPIELFEKIASPGRKFTLGGGTVPNRFADKNFALFLISEYSKYGFVPGKRNLYKDIDTHSLSDSLIENFEFDNSYIQANYPSIQETL